MMSDKGRARRHDFPPIAIRIEPNHDGGHVVWSIQLYDAGFTKCTGLAVSRLDGMQKALDFIEAIAKAAASSAKPTLVVNNVAPEGATP